MTVGAGLAGEAADAVAALEGCGMAALVSHPRLLRLHRSHLEGLEGPLAGKGIALHRVTFPAGERHKNLATVNRVYRRFLELGLGRHDVVLAWGGGVVGDLAGYAAATWLRGVRCLQVPTTLMAMVDSAVGGKTGVDLPQGKNLVGAFHQPRAVFCDVELLRTLPRREYLSGLAEAAKYALVFDGGFYRRLLDAAPSLLGRKEPELASTVAACVSYKARMVEEDELDLTGRRALLNYGHTFAHALEAATSYRSLLHGEAVALGMRMAARLSEMMGLAPPGLLQEHEELLDALGQGGTITGELRVEDVLRGMAYDKKRRGGRLNFVLLKGIGDPVVVEAEPDLKVETAVREVLGRGLAQGPKAGGARGS